MHRVLITLFVIIMCLAAIIVLKKYLKMNNPAVVKFSFFEAIAIALAIPVAQCSLSSNLLPNQLINECVWSQGLLLITVPVSVVIVFPICYYVNSFVLSVFTRFGRK